MGGAPALLAGCATTSPETASTPAAAGSDGRFEQPTVFAGLSRWHSGPRYTDPAEE